MPKSQDQVLEQFRNHLASLPPEDAKPQWLIGHVVDFFEQNARDFVADLGGKEAVVAATEAAYHQFVTPIDLPGVPNFMVEPALDNALAKIAGQMVGRMIDQLLAT